MHAEANGVASVMMRDLRHINFITSGVALVLTSGTRHHVATGMQQREVRSNPKFWKQSRLTCRGVCFTPGCEAACCNISQVTVAGTILGPAIGLPRGKCWKPPTTNASITDTSHWARWPAGKDVGCRQGSAPPGPFLPWPGHRFGDQNDGCARQRWYTHEVQLPCSKSKAGEHADCQHAV